MIGTKDECPSPKLMQGRIGFRKKMKRELLYALFASTSYPILFAFMFDFTLEILIYSVLHALLSAIFIYRIVSSSILVRDRNLGMPQVFILINALYFGASSIKYFESQLYSGYISDPTSRFIFSIVALTTLWGAFELLRYMKPLRRAQNTNYINQLSTRKVWLLRIIILFMLSGIVYTVVQGISRGPGYLYQWQGDPAQLAIERTYLSTGQKIIDWLSGLYPFLLPVFLGLHYKQRGGLLLTTISIIAMLSYSLVSGSRAIFFAFGIGLFVALIILGKTNGRKFSWLIFSAPLMVAGGSLLALTISNRISINNNDLIRWQLAYRFDLTDFAATMAARRPFIDFNSSLASDAIHRAAPKAMMPNKFDAITDTYSNQLNQIGLNPYADYNDTYFSVGVQMFGGLGFILFPLIVILSLYILEKNIRKFFGIKQGYIIVVCMFMLYSSAETSLDGLIGAWRMLPVFILIGMIIFRFILKPNGLSGRSNIRI